MRSTQSSDAGRMKQATAPTKDATAYRRVDIQAVQNVLLLLEKDIDDNNEDYRNTASQLRCVVNTINAFTDAEKCVQFIKYMNDEKAYMIISDSLGQHIVTRIHNMTQVKSIFILSSKNERHEQWANEWPKIKGVFTEMASVCQALKQAVHQYEQNFTPINFMATSEDMFNKNFNRLPCSFMYTQIMTEILLTTKFEENHIKKFIEHCRYAFADNKEELLDVEELERKYRQRSPISWYTSVSFLSSMLNQALRQLNVDTIIKMSVFMGDLHRDIEKLHNKQSNDNRISQIFTVYRGQGLFKTDFEQMKKTKGGLMSFNNFLSTSTDRAVSLAFAESNVTNADIVGILFVMRIDRSQPTTPFAFIKDISVFKGEVEVLFSMHTVFRIHDIKRMLGKQSLFQVDLTLTSDNDENLRVLTEYIREEIDPESKGWDRLGKLLLKIGEFDKAEEIYEAVLVQTTNDIEKALIYYHIGCAKKERGRYKEAITFYKKAFKIQHQSLPSNHLDFANTNNCLGIACYCMGENSKALLCHETALAIRERLLHPAHPDVAKSYNNIGTVYYRMGEYSNALLSCEKALEIRQQSLPLNHPQLASSYNCTGMVYSSMGEHAKAFPFYQKALAIRHESLPRNHTDLAMSYKCTGDAYYSMGEPSKALSYYKKALVIRQQSLPSDHPDLAMSYNCTGVVYSNMKKHSKALSYNRKALAIRQQSLPRYHPDLALSYLCTGDVYYSTGEQSKALSYYKKAHAIRQQSLSPNHPDLAVSSNSIGMVCSNLGKHSQALLFYEKALQVQQQSLPSNHPHLASSYNNIGMMYFNMGEYAKALSYYKKALVIRQQSLPPDHPYLPTSCNNIGMIYFNMSEYSKALSYYEKVLAIRQQ